MRTLNLGIVAHVDAGKTTLTERLLHAAGVIEQVGNVDAGTTQTDYLDLERARGITIRAAVVSFVLGGLRVNLIDTPGHPDFIAEVERSLGVLDGAVLVVSAVEGVQAQTRVLMRALQRLRLPTLLFVNKIDRTGAQETALIHAMRDRLTPSLVAMGTTVERGTRRATYRPFCEDELDLTAVADHDDRVLAALAGEAPLASHELRRAFVRACRRGRVHPVLFGAALTGTGVEPLVRAIVELLPSHVGGADRPLSGQVFKIGHDPSGARVALVRLFAGTLRVRDRIGADTVTAIDVFDGGGTVRRDAAVAGDIARVQGLTHARIGHSIGLPKRRTEVRFPPPTLETIVQTRPQDRVGVYAALATLADEDPLIGLHVDPERQDLRLSLYGEVQKEVVAATLAADFGIEVSFSETAPLCIERVVATGTAVETMPRGRSAARPFLAGVGVRIEPGPVGMGIAFHPESQLGALPAAFMTAVADGVTAALRQGLAGWAVTDCHVWLIHSQYAPRQSHAHQGFSKAMSSVGSDFRLLTPLVVMDALREAGTVVCEPVHRYRIETVGNTVPPLVTALARLEAPPLDQAEQRRVTVLSGLVRAAAIHRLQQQLPDLTSGEALLETEFDSYQPVRGVPPRRPRLDHNPLNRREYLLRVLGVA